MRHLLLLPALCLPLSALAQGAQPPLDWAQVQGSGVFGDWIEDDAGLPAYAYTLDAQTDPRALYETFLPAGPSRDHWFQVGNARHVSLAHVDGSVELFEMDEVPLVRNHIDPSAGAFGGGFGYLVDVETGAVASTHGEDLPPGALGARIYGAGYATRALDLLGVEITERIVAPYGDVPALVSSITLKNTGSRPRTLRYLPYWDVNLFERFPGLQASGGLSLGEVWPLATAFDAEDATLSAAPLKGPTGDTVNIYPSYPPVTALAPLGHDVDGLDSDCRTFFGAGGRAHPDALQDGAADGSTLPLPVSDLLQPACLILQRTLTLAPGASAELGFALAFGGSTAEVEETLAALRTQSAGHPAPARAILAQTQAAWADALPRFTLPGYPAPAREMTWSAYMLSAGSVYSRYIDAFTLTQGSAYLYDTGLNAAPRDPLQHALAAVYSDPPLARETLRYWMSQQRQDGYLPYTLYGRNWQADLVWKPSDLNLWLLLAALEYVDATGDAAFLSEWIPYFPLGTGGGATALEHLKQAYAYLVDTVGSGRHGLLHLQMFDWNDGLLSGDATQQELLLTRLRGESTLNAAMAVYVFERLAGRLDLEGDVLLAEEVREERERQRRASLNQWRGDHLSRAYVAAGEELGADQIYLEPQPWGLLSPDLLSDARASTLLDAIDLRLRDGTGLGTRVLEIPHEGGEVPGEVTNGGIWASINGWLVWGASARDPARAFAHWLDSTFANHAERFPELWFGIWSGPDAYNASQSERPGETWAIPGAAMQAFPVMNHHPHAWPLFNAVMLSGVKARGGILTLAPRWPLPAFEAHTALFDLSVDDASIRFVHHRVEVTTIRAAAPAGWPAPQAAALRRGAISLRIDGAPRPFRLDRGALVFDLAPGEEALLRLLP